MPTTAEPLISAPESVVEAAGEWINKAIAIDHATRPIFGRSYSDRSLFTRIHKAEVDGERPPTGQRQVVGRREHPFDFAEALNLSVVNEHHSTCIETKVAATVGLGFVVDGDDAEVEETPRRKFEQSTVDEELDALTNDSFQAVLSDACQDYWGVGNGYIEVVREGDQIVGLHHMPTTNTWAHVEDEFGEWHYVFRGAAGAERHFARFGDRKGLIERGRSGDAGFSIGDDGQDENTVSEVIHFRRPTSLDKWYGYPDWLAAVPSIELNQMMTQHRFDFFLNRGVPEFMLFIMGQQLSKDDWKKVEDAMRANIGLGNSHKSLALNLTNKDIQVTLEKLAMDSRNEDSFAKDKESIALSIVSAHRVPPLLAGIQIPGKLGATNELPNALMAFQLLVIGQAQKLFQRTLAMTLAGDDNGGLSVAPEDFTFRRITDEIDLGTMDTTSRMRQTVPEARAEGRDMTEGVRE